jgi:hypothetical protein
VTWRAAALALMLYVQRIFAVGAGFHRYFAHRAFSSSRAREPAFAFLAQTSAQRDILWWPPSTAGTVDAAREWHPRGSPSAILSRQADERDCSFGGPKPADRFDSGRRRSFGDREESRARRRQTKT